MTSLFWEEFNFPFSSGPELTGPLVEAPISFGHFISTKVKQFVVFCLNEFKLIYLALIVTLLTNLIYFGVQYEEFSNLSSYFI